MIHEKPTPNAPGSEAEILCFQVLAPHGGQLVAGGETEASVLQSLGPW